MLLTVFFCLFVCVFVLFFVDTVSGADIRLVGGSGPHEGRLEVNYQGRWGTVCHSLYGTKIEELSEIVCRQLGFGNFESYVTSSYVFGGGGTGWVWFRLEFCSADIEFPCIELGFGKAADSSCNHTNDIGIICSGKYNQLIISLSYFFSPVTVLPCVLE